MTVFFYTLLCIVPCCINIKPCLHLWSEKRQTTSATLHQRFSIPVLAPPSSAYFACLSLLTHLIQIISSLEVSSVHELCSHWHGPYTVFIAPYSLSRGNLLKFTSLRNIHSRICAAQRLHTRTSVTSYTSVNKYNLNSRLAHFNALWMEHIRSLQTGIMAEYPVMSTLQGTYVRIEQMSEAIRETYKMCRAGGREDWNWEPLLYTDLNSCLNHQKQILYICKHTYRLWVRTAGIVVYSPRIKKQSSIKCAAHIWIFALNCSGTVL